jgi:hypothetical protein
MSPWRAPWLLALIAIGCDRSPPPPPPAGRALPTATAKTAAPVCTFGADQTCNDDPLLSKTHGTCRQDGTCECQPGYAKNEATGRCR